MATTVCWSLPVESEKEERKYLGRCDLGHVGLLTVATTVVVAIQYLDARLVIRLLVLLNTVDGDVMVECCLLHVARRSIAIYWKDCK